MQEILTILGSVGFNWHVALANFFNFLVILFLLNVFFFKKIGKTLETRHNVIERGLNQARDAERALSAAEEEKNTILKNAHKERDSILAKSEVLAQESAAHTKEAAQKEIDARLAKLALEEKNLEESVAKAFAEKAPALVAKLYAKTLMKELTEEDNNAFIAKVKAL